MKNQEREIVDATLLQIDSTIKRLSRLNIHGLDNAGISNVCSKILAFSERLNTLAYTNLSSLEAGDKTALSYLSLLNQISNKQEE